MGKRPTWLLLAALLLPPPAAFAQAPMRCGTELVEIGDTKAQVLQACGEPDYVDGYRWYYEMGPGVPTRIVVFTPAGVVTSIDTVR